MDVRQLRIFESVYEHRHLSRAATLLNLSQSAVSFHLAKLEAELGAQLFTREARGMAPTAAAERLHGHAEKVLRGMRDLQDDMLRRSDELSGEVALGLAYTAMKVIGRELIRTVFTGYPAVRLSLMDTIPGATLPALLQTSLDAALVFNPPDHPEIHSRAVARESFFCFGRADVIGERDDPIGLDELLALPLIFYRRLGTLLDNTNLLRQIDARAKLRVNSVQAITGALLDGFGCMIGTKMYFREQMQDGTLHHRPIAGAPIVRTLCHCRIGDRAPTVLIETMSGLLLALIREAIEAGRWDAALI